MTFKMFQTLSMNPSMSHLLMFEGNPKNILAAFTKKNPSGITGLMAEGKFPLLI